MQTLSKVFYSLIRDKSLDWLRVPGLSAVEGHIGIWREENGTGAPALQMCTWCVHGITGYIPTGCLHPWMWSSAENKIYRLGMED